MAIIQEELREINEKISFYFKMINLAAAAIFILLIILLQNNKAEGFDFGNVMRYYRVMGILFGALFLLTLLFPFSNIVLIISFALNLIVLYICVRIRKEIKRWNAAALQ